MNEVQSTSRCIIEVSSKPELSTNKVIDMKHEIR